MFRFSFIFVAPLVFQFSSAAESVPESCLASVNSYAYRSACHEGRSSDACFISMMDVGAATGASAAGSKAGGDLGRKVGSSLRDFVEKQGLTKNQAKEAALFWNEIDETRLSYIAEEAHYHEKQTSGIQSKLANAAKSGNASQVKSLMAELEAGQRSTAQIKQSYQQKLEQVVQKHAKVLDSLKLKEKIQSKMKMLANLDAIELKQRLDGKVIWYGFHENTKAIQMSDLESQSVKEAYRQKMMTLQKIGIVPEFAGKVIGGVGGFLLFSPEVWRPFADLSKLKSCAGKLSPQSNLTDGDSKVLAKYLVFKAGYSDQNCDVQMPYENLSRMLKENELTPGICNVIAGLNQKMKKMQDSFELGKFECDPAGGVSKATIKAGSNTYQVSFKEVDGRKVLKGSIDPRQSDSNEASQFTCPMVVPKNKNSVDQSWWCGSSELSVKDSYLNGRKAASGKYFSGDSLKVGYSGSCEPLTNDDDQKLSVKSNKQLCMMGEQIAAVTFLKSKIEMNCPVNGVGTPASSSKSGVVKSGVK